MNEEFKELQKENEKIREILSEIIGTNHPLFFPIWTKINKLIDIELKQKEEICD